MQALQDVAELNRRFGIAGAAEIVSGNSGLPLVRVRTGSAQAEIYLHGAQVTSWQPSGSDEVIFLSRQSRFEDGKAIRGGIPICFPWFRGKSDNPKAPAHGVVRTKSWQLDSIDQAERGVVVTLSTESDEQTRRWWPHDFRLTHRITAGDPLALELIVQNTGSTAFHFEEALHTYHRVGDAGRIQVQGLDGVTFLDNMDGNREKLQQGPIVMDGPIDNAYLKTMSTLEIVDPVLGRRIRIEKQSSQSTVVWNPWESGAAKLADLGNDEWRQFACVEASNILSCAVSLDPGEQHAMTAKISVS